MLVVIFIVEDMQGMGNIGNGMDGKVWQGNFVTICRKEMEGELGDNWKVRNRKGNFVTI